jgi:hypothetical protein
MTAINSRKAPGRIPLWVKIAYSLFAAVMIPTYWREYGPANFLYFCDVAVLLTLLALWLENSLLSSMAAVGILLPQLAWVVDFAAHAVGLKLTGMSDYMLDDTIPRFTRAISLFHGWLPFFLIYVLRRLGYDRGAFPKWVALGVALLVICYFWMPKPGTQPEGSHQPVNINYVFGFSSKTPQSGMPANAWFLVVLCGLPALVWWPTHRLLLRWCPRPA